ncbi:hypothetical protein B9Z47_13180 [Limnohabitans sp. 2KL-1]|nr:hypothetical protein B9Z47_13180 [Limnohabitans sp. 2KL-1]
MHSGLSTSMSSFGQFRRQVAAAMLVAFTTSLVVGCGGSSLLPTAGTLDATFGAGTGDGTPDGVVGRSLGAGNDYAKTMAVQTDGKIVVAGSTTSDANGGTSNIVVERFNSDGSLDVTFGVGNSDGSPDGTVTLDLGDSSDVAMAVKIQADGKIVVAGTSKPTNGTSNIILVRLTSAGVLDTSFGADANDGTVAGVVAVDLGGAGEDVANALAIQADGKLVVAGSTTLSGTKNLMLARVNTNGSLDSAFGASGTDGTPAGVVSISLGDGDDQANGLVIQPDNRIVVAGTTRAADSTTNAFVARLNSDGELDSSFGVGSADGTVDGVAGISFGNGNDAASAVTLQSDGKILVVGATTAADNSTNIAVARLNTDGSLDNSFGADASDGTPHGVTGLSLGTGNDTGVAITMQADGKIVVAGFTVASDGSTNAAVARLLSNGTLDTSFGQGNSDGTPDGVVAISLGAGNDFAHALAVQSDGKILIAGDRTNAGSSDVWLARLLAI